MKDRTFDDYRSQPHVARAPEVVATLRNLAMLVLQLVGFTNIASGLR